MVKKQPVTARNFLYSGHKRLHSGIMYQSLYASLPQTWSDSIEQLNRLGVAPSSDSFIDLAWASLQQTFRTGLPNNLGVMPGGWQGEADTVLVDGIIYDLETRPLFRTSHCLLLPDEGIQGFLLRMQDTPSHWTKLERALVEMPASSRLLGLWFPESASEAVAGILKKITDYGTLMEKGQLVLLIGQEKLYVNRGYGSDFELILGAEGKEEVLDGFIQGCLVSFRNSKQAAPKIQTPPAPRPRSRKGNTHPLGLRHNKNGQTKSQKDAFLPDPADPEGNYALHIAAIKGNSARVSQLLSEGHDPNCKNKAGDTPLHCIVKEAGQEDIADLLLMAGADLNARNHICVAPLHVAVECNNLTMLLWLLDKGAEIEARNNRAYTPLHKATATGNIEMVQLLLDHGADIHAKMEKDIQPLHLAAWYGHEKLIECLLDGGASINATNDDGNCPLHFAAFNGQVKVIKRLMQLAADPSLLNSNGETYLQGINEGYTGAMVHVLN